MKLQRPLGLLLTLLAATLSAQVEVTPPTVPAAPTTSAEDTFTNPLLETSPDPWVIRWNGFYYFTSTTSTNLTLRKTADITDLRHAEKKIVWTPEPGHPWSSDLWAPELHRYNDAWYIYFAADAGDNPSHRLFVVENTSDDPLEGTWTLKGQITDSSNKWAIDPTTFDLRGQHYLVWSGWKGDSNGEQRLYIAHMSNPWTIDSKRTEISKPKYPWEKHGDLPHGHLHINEGPEFLAHGNHLFLLFSASACWTDFYTLGALEADAGTDPLNKKSWTKIDHPLLSTNPQAQAFGPGHNSFFQTPNGNDGHEDWILYHANPAPGEGCGKFRSPRIQRFTWDDLGRPDFGTPVPLNQPLEKPTQESQHLPNPPLP